MRPADVGGATLCGASITCTQGIYPAELQAIARAAAMLPLHLDLHIHSDSQASIAAIAAHAAEGNERRRMRMPCRKILQLIHHLVARRKKAGGSLRLSHVRAHTADMDVDSVGK
jgi:hypothetical protein